MKFALRVLFYIFFWSLAKCNSLLLFFGKELWIEQSYPELSSIQFSRNLIKGIHYFQVNRKKRNKTKFYHNLDNSLFYLFFLLQTATSSWPMLRCRRGFPLCTAPMASVSSQASLGQRSCRRAAPVSSCMVLRQAKASSSASTRLWRSAKSLRMRSCSTKRQVSQMSLS